MKAYESLQETLSFYGVKYNKPYYISSGNPIFEFPKEAFRMDFYAFCICLSGKIDLEIDNRHYCIGLNNFLVSAPATIIRFVHISKDFRMKLLFFEKNFLLKNISNPFFIEKLSLFRNRAFSIVAPEAESSLRLLTLLDYLHKQAGRQGKFIEDIVRTIIINILLEIATLVNTQRAEKTDDTEETNNLFFKFTKLVQENATFRKDVQFYADKLFITNKYLITVVKKATGKTPHEIIDENLLKEACVLLGNPEKTIFQIALDTGFSSTSSFGRFFKKYAAISPQEYRKQQSL
ncbi:AraC family transcriptional regulator [Olivibacter sp. SDN3]|uniref:helix-turn-helix domain-containing protein n=1 Tax=Olivibacter sp. SDN3 TaxID=2764720 RepID=UPI0016513DBE|nr:AraC family transcriptional regulator [Olivibacter sp. SDN3]QNL49849.1 AraC family transcriptional regulator [Olivibacter sp. SDN3]